MVLVLVPPLPCSSILLLPGRRQLLLTQAQLNGWKKWIGEGCFSCYSSLCLCLEKLTWQGAGGRACIPPPECWNPLRPAGRLSLERQGLAKKWMWVCCLKSNLSCTLTRTEDPMALISVHLVCRSFSGSGKERCGPSATGRAGLWWTSWESWPRKKMKAFAGGGEEGGKFSDTHFSPVKHIRMPCNCPSSLSVSGQNKTRGSIIKA